MNIYLLLLRPAGARAAEPLTDNEEVIKVSTRAPLSRILPLPDAVTFLGWKVVFHESGELLGHVTDVVSVTANKQGVPWLRIARTAALPQYGYSGTEYHLFSLSPDVFPSGSTHDKVLYAIPPRGKKC